MSDKITKLERTKRLAFSISKCCDISPELHERVYQYEESLFWVKCPKCGKQGDNDTYTVRAYMNWERKLKDDVIKALQTQLAAVNDFLEEIGSLGGKYPYLNETSIVADSRALKTKFSNNFNNPRT